MITHYTIEKLTVVGGNVEMYTLYSKNKFCLYIVYAPQTTTNNAFLFHFSPSRQYDAEIDKNLSLYRHLSQGFPIGLEYPSGESR